MVPASFWIQLNKRSSLLSLFGGGSSAAATEIEKAAIKIQVCVATPQRLNDDVSCTFFGKRDCAC